MKKLIQISIVVVLVFTLLQIIAGAGFSGVHKAVPSQNLSLAPAQTSLQSALVITCWDGRVVSCVMPNVGWNS